MLTHRRKHMLREALKHGFRFFLASEAPALLQPQLIDGGLVILSKHPIVYSARHGYRAGIHSDGLTTKEVLFARVQLPSGHLNVFTTHTQATYCEADPSRHLPCCHVRLAQLVEARDFIYEQLSKVAGPGDLSIFMGDFNVNGRNHNYPMEQVLEYLKDEVHPEPPFVDGLHNEYDLLLHIFNH